MTAGLIFNKGFFIFVYPLTSIKDYLGSIFGKPYTRLPFEIIIILKQTKINNMDIRPVKEFPLLKKYKKKFDINEGTIFAYDNVIYSDFQLPNHLIIHENTHFKQQEEYGLKKWVKKYLKDDEFRLKMEIEAYKNQVNSIKDRNERNRLKINCCRDLSGSLYGNLLTFNEAMEII